MDVNVKKELKTRKICSVCIYDDTVPGIQFDEKGICNYCRQITDLEKSYQTGSEEGYRKLEEIFSEIRKNGRGKKYDCVVGLSGGTDSSYMLCLAKERGLRPLAVHYDNTWNSTVATENIRKITKGLDVDLDTYVVNNIEMDDIYRAFFEASVPAIDVPTDLALTEVLYRKASQYGVKYILEGHSFVAEGISPGGYSYFDGKYIKAIHETFGKIKMKTFPNMDFFKFLYWVLIKKIHKIRPYWYIDYSKKKAKQYLVKNFGWIDYGGHHLENRITAFSHKYHNPYKFGIDQRNNSLSAEVRCGSLSRESALKQFENFPEVDERLNKYVLKRLGYDKSSFEKIMKAEPKAWHNYPSYKKRFERFRPLFFVLAKANLVPMSFYLKYCLSQK